ncbi:hypothetical protein QJS04_geneDACA020258 [Acorus gramineus]|uniref:3-hydroxyisobutyrate dehydrogenase n=1 Tax=Acorus gramineus TaxID=55184 RepID=A0AAV9A488_ACOGR|nr:hypothetical protein QJS04_geneDACA020258 [Acorus gramineus]
MEEGRLCGYPNPIKPGETRVGWIGIGVMGEAMAARVLSAGYAVTVYARDPSKAGARALLHLGARIAASPREAARASDVVFTMVGHPSDVRSVVLDGETGVLSGLRRGGVAVDCTSSSPDLAREVAEEAAKRGCHAVDAPVSGGDEGAREGRLAVLAGGERGVVEWLGPLLGEIGRATTYMGEAGSGQKCKIANQIVVAANLVGLSEGMVFAERAGVGARRWLEVAAAEETKVGGLFGGRMVGRKFWVGGFAEYMVKDLGMALDGGGGEGVVALPGAALSLEMFKGMVGNGDGKIGLHGVITVLERINGISIEKS